MSASHPLILQSLLGRLVDGEDTPAQAGDGLAALREDIRRDMEALLNTRRPHLSWPATMTELDGSILAYGIGDVAGRHFESTMEREAFCAEVALSIRRFDPRLRSVSVKLSEEARGRGVGLRIEAVVDADPVPLSLTFATQLDPALRRLSVEELPS